MTIEEELAGAENLKKCVRDFIPRLNIENLLLLQNIINRIIATKLGFTLYNGKEDVQ